MASIDVSKLPAIPIDVTQFFTGNVPAGADQIYVMYEILEHAQSGAGQAWLLTAYPSGVYSIFLPAYAATSAVKSGVELASKRFASKRFVQRGSGNGAECGAISKRSQ